MTKNHAQDVVNWIQKYDYPGRFITREAKLAMELCDSDSPVNLQEKVKLEYARSGKKLLLNIYKNDSTIYISAASIKKFKELGWKGIGISIIKAASKREILFLSEGKYTFYVNNTNSNMIYNKELGEFIKSFFGTNKEKSEKLVLELMPHNYRNKTGYSICIYNENNFAQE